MGPQGATPLQTGPAARRNSASKGRQQNRHGRKGPAGRGPEATALAGTRPQGHHRPHRPWGYTVGQSRRSPAMWPAQKTQSPGAKPPANPHRWRSPGDSTRNPSRRTSSNWGKAPAFWQRDRAAPPQVARAAAGQPAFLSGRPTTAGPAQRARRTAARWPLHPTWRGVGSLVRPPKGRFAPGHQRFVGDTDASPA